MYEIHFPNSRADKQHNVPYSHILTALYSYNSMADKQYKYVSVLYKIISPLVFLPSEFMRTEEMLPLYIFLIVA